MKLYIAYGSNLNLEQMKLRCPSSKLWGTGFIKDWELVYRGSKTGAYATIRRKMNSYVPVGIWKITQMDELALDRYEGYPSFYQKYVIDFLSNGHSNTGMVYIMRPDSMPGKPSEHYIDIIYKGYQELGLDFRFLYDSLIKNKQEANPKKEGN